MDNNHQLVESGDGRLQWSPSNPFDGTSFNPIINININININIIHNQNIKIITTVAQDLLFWQVIYTSSNTNLGKFDFFFFKYLIH